MINSDGTMTIKGSRKDNQLLYGYLPFFWPSNLSFNPELDFFVTYRKLSNTNPLLKYKTSDIHSPSIPGNKTN